MRSLAARFRRLRPRVVGLLGCLTAVLAAAGLAASGPLSDAEKEEFLLRARVVSRQIIPIGVTASERATLTDGRLTHAAHIQTIDQTHRRLRARKAVYINLRDSYEFNIAAYRLDRLLDLRMVPVSVERSVAGERAAVTWWVDDVLMMEAERRSRGVKPPDLAHWNDQMQQARVFTQLVFNTDPNLGNFLVATGWRLWMIDFTRSFRAYKRLPEPELIERIDRRVYRGLRRLSRKALRRETEGYLTGPEVNAVLARREQLLHLIDARIAAQGEPAVICDLPGH